MSSKKLATGQLVSRDVLETEMHYKITLLHVLGVDPLIPIPCQEDDQSSTSVPDKGIRDEDGIVEEELLQSHYVISKRAKTRHHIPEWLRDRANVKETATEARASP